MSRTREYWWSYVKGMIRNYPALKVQYQINFQEANNFVSVEQKRLPKVKQKEYLAVTAAIEDTLKFKDGAERMKVIQYVFWNSNYTLTGAALRAHCSERTAQEWHRIFIRTVAKNYGLLD
jgi:hypothetical protein